MGNIKLPTGEIVADKRTNGARLRLDVSDWIKIFITIGSVFFVIISGWTSLRMTMEQQTILMAQNLKDITENKTVSRDNRKDIEFLKWSFDKINIKLDKLIENK